MTLSFANRSSFQVSTYSFDTHSKTAQIRVMNVSDGTSALISEDLSASEPFWIGDNEIAYLKASDNGCTTLMYQDVHDPFKYATPHSDRTKCIKLTLLQEAHDPPLCWLHL